jgi:hypothetical protein
MKTAPMPVLWFLKLAGALAVTTPWKTVYCRPGEELNYALAAHEAVHVAQIERDGAVMWTVKIFYYLLRYGYNSDLNPYENEARKAEKWTP